jgi:hypothetical protein
MKLRDFRVGNFLNDRENRLCRVEVIDYNNAERFSAPAIKGATTSLPHAPIPISEEWHNRFGVEKDGFNEFKYSISVHQQIIFSGDYVFLRDIERMDGRPSMNDNICSLWNNDKKKRTIYIHEFQNLYFTLKGAELQLTF